MVNKIACAVLGMFVGIFAHAEEIRVSCRFGAPFFTSQRDAEADIFRRAYLAGNDRAFIMRMEPPEITYGPMPSGYWDAPKISANEDTLSFVWRIKKVLPDRNPSIVLTINRFSGEAVEYHEIEIKRTSDKWIGLHQWTRTGKCDFQNRKM